MLRHNAVHDAAVVVLKQEGQELEMIGFIATRGNNNSVDQDQVGIDAIKEHSENPTIREDQNAMQIQKEIRSQLQALLPSYMIPTRIMLLDKMPVNANGKVNRQELSRIAQVAPLQRKLASVRVAPRNEIEAALCEEFADVLGVEAGIAVQLLRPRRPLAHGDEARSAHQPSP